MKAYTLIELIISVLLLAIVLLGGTTLFYQNLKSSGLSDVDSKVSNTLQTILRSIENDIRYSKVSGVGIGTRLDCLSAGVSGYAGSKLYVSDLNGLETVYSLLNGRVASGSSQTGEIVYLNDSEIKVESLEFTWYCQTNISDKIKILINASSNVLNTGIKFTQGVSTEINLLNSGLN